MSEEVEYCIWNYWDGRMDTSTDWNKLFKLVSKYNGVYNHSQLHIIPTSSLGKGEYRSHKQVIEDIDELERFNIEWNKKHKGYMKGLKSILKEKK